MGDGSPQALIPILTGKSEPELPLTLKNKKNSNYVDVYPFIWGNFSESGYVTQYGEDTPFIGKWNVSCVCVRTNLLITSNLHLWQVHSPIE